MTVAAEKDAFVMGLSVETQPGFFLKENLFKGVFKDQSFKTSQVN